MEAFQPDEELAPGMDQFVIYAHPRPNPVRYRARLVPCHPWCNQLDSWHPGTTYHQDINTGRAWVTTPCEGMIECVRCHQRNRAVSAASPCHVPCLFCVYCEGSLQEYDQKPGELRRQLVRAAELHQAIKDALPQPIWEEMLDHLQ